MGKLSHFDNKKAASERLVSFAMVTICIKKKIQNWGVGVPGLYLTYKVPLFCLEELALRDVSWKYLVV